MAIEKKSLQFDHVLVYKMEGKMEDWQEGFAVMEEAELEQVVYRNGPVIFTYEAKGDSGTFTYYMPVNDEVELAEDSDIQYDRRLDLKDALVLRQAQEIQDFSTAFEQVKTYGEVNGIPLTDQFYCVLLEVYGDIIIDLYVPRSVPHAIH
ncbi:hypothetical protein FZC83_10020 [Rossellomorea marisflavi]|uniref:DUF5085 family protein n=2 Tax=Rossellomorea marisflavi TaxID=189381 RepID=A0A5D4RZI1_9BACI|nr:hypothetical protein [Rossellomorea marisflavi]KQU63701.1 hypothetical protein ASG66_04685 [Bacillus sp. Leaf406]MDW4525834.1 hypothetical protein [Rossellomorea marisflavi]TYS55268.1 hypothetical protein FZC83_10020 [Rossellomorea marisflavi]UTE71720.1 hypothetical protein M1I95_15795 [Rossellomorea marisflavi]